MDEKNSQTAMDYLIEETQKVFEMLEAAAGGQSKSPSPDPGECSSSSIIAQIRKRIRLESNADQDSEQSTVKEVVQDYLKMPQEEYSVLR